MDCQSIFQAGQLAVAMGRVKEESGLRVVNFNRQAVIPQPKVVLDFLEKTTAKFCEDLSCCHPARFVILTCIFKNIFRSAFITVHRN